MTAPLVGRDIWLWRNGVCADGSLLPATRLVLMRLSFHTDTKTGLAWPSQMKLASEVVMARSSIQRHLRAAQQRGWIATDGQFKRGRVTKYKLADPGDSTFTKLTDNFESTRDVRTVRDVTDGTTAVHDRAVGPDLTDSEEPRVDSRLRVTNSPVTRQSGRTTGEALAAGVLPGGRPSSPEQPANLSGGPFSDAAWRAYRHAWMIAYRGFHGNRPDWGMRAALRVHYNTDEIPRAVEPLIERYAGIASAAESATVGTAEQKLIAGHVEILKAYDCTPADALVGAE